MLLEEVEINNNTKINKMKKLSIFKRFIDLKEGDEVYVNQADIKLVLSDEVSDNLGVPIAFAISKKALMHYTSVSSRLTDKFIKIRKLKRGFGYKVLEMELDHNVLYLHHLEYSEDATNYMLIVIQKNALNISFYDQSHPEVKMETMFEEFASGVLDYDENQFEKDLKAYFVFKYENDFSFFSYNRITLDLEKVKKLVILFDNRDQLKQISVKYLDVFIELFITRFMKTYSLSLYHDLLRICLTEKAFKLFNDLIVSCGRYNELLQFIAASKGLTGLLFDIYGKSQYFDKYPESKQFFYDLENMEPSVVDNSSDPKTYSDEELQEEIDFILTLEKITDEHKERLRILHKELDKR